MEEKLSLSAGNAPEFQASVEYSLREEGVMRVSRESSNRLSFHAYTFQKK